MLVQDGGRVLRLSVVLWSLRCSALLKAGLQQLFVTILVVWLLMFVRLTQLQRANAASGDGYSM
jgi:hypothetical protein